MSVRPRKKDRNLPQCVYLKHGAYWYVKKGKWTRLGINLADALKEYARLLTAPESGMDALIDKALPEITHGRAPNTVTQYELAAKKLKNAFIEFRPEQVTPKDVAGFMQLNKGTPNLANRCLSVLRLVMHKALDWGIIDSNPCIGIKRHAEAKRDRYLTDDEYLAIYKAASPAMRPIMAVCYYTGQRIGDVLSIRLQDITPEGILFKQQKTGQRLLVVMTPELQQAVDEAKALPRPVRGMTLFCTKRGGRKYAYRTVRDMWDAAVILSKVEDATLHDLRAKAITDAKNQGKDAQALGGHSTEAMTNRYIRARDTIVAIPPSFRQR